MTIADASPALRKEMLSAQREVEAKASLLGSISFRYLLDRYSDEHCTLDAQGDVWSHSAGKWWSDDTKRRFLGWLDKQ